MPKLRVIAPDPEDVEPRTTVLNSGAVAFSVDEVASVLRVNRKTVVAMIERGQLAEVRYARRRWVPAHVLRAFLLLDPSEPSAAGASRT